MTTAQPSQGSPDSRMLSMALDLGWAAWTVGCTVGLGQTPRQVSGRARDLPGLLAQMAPAKRRFGLPPDAPVHSVYEAGRDGLWLPRCLRAHGLQNSVGEASSLAVQRRSRRSQPDQLDGQKLLPMLVRFVRGETRRWTVVHGPSTADAVLRQPHRELRALQEERTQHINRMTGLLAGLGLAARSDHTVPERLPALRQWAGPPGPARLQERRLRELARWSLVQRQRQDWANAEARLVRNDQPQHVAPVRPRRSVRGSGAQSAWLLVHEVFGGRAIRHRRELAALAGLTPTPYPSGQPQREQGISKAGSTRRRWLRVALAWGWLHWPPERALSRWDQARFGQGSARLRQWGLVALARTLLVALWRLVAPGEVPPGAVVAAWSRKVTGRWAQRRPGGTAVAMERCGMARWRGLSGWHTRHETHVRRMP